MEQNDILAVLIPIYKDPTLDPTQPLRVVFKHQPAIDSGGPRREMYTLGYDKLVNSTEYK